MEHECCKQGKNRHNNEDNKPERDEKQQSSIFLLIGALLMGAVLVQAYNFTQINQTNALLERQTAALSLSSPQGSVAIDMSGWTDNEKMNYEMHGIVPARSQRSATASAPSDPNINNTTANFSDVTPKGTPRIYGAELKVSFDDVSVNDPQKADATIAKLSQFDQENSGKYIEPTGDKKERYIKIASQIACEYCCGAQSLIFSDGKKACGCAHSYSMRGLAKYLIDKHGSEFTDDQILEELGKWKTLYFPGVLAQKAQVLKDKGIPFSYINLASNKYRGIEKGASQGDSMVGGC